jgi:biotin synthase
MIREVKKLGMEACVTLGMLTKEQTLQLKEAGLDYYNHNIDTSPEFYNKIVTTRTFQDRLKTIEYICDAGIKLCCGGILGLGESNDDRIQMIVTLARLKTPPASVPINQLIPIPGTPLASAQPVDSFDFLRTIALCRLLLPNSSITLAAGRKQMSEELQALCFFAGANSIFYGQDLLTTQNASPDQDDRLLQKLNLHKAKQ